MSIVQLLTCLLSSVLAGFIQGVTGFGFGIIVVMFFQRFLGVAASASISQCLSLFLCLSLALRYRRHIRWNLLVKPLLFYVPGYFVFLRMVGRVDVAAMKPFLGLFLIVLSIYFLRFSEKIPIKDTWLAVGVCALLSAACDAAFGIGGPPMVLYMLTLSRDREEYLATIQCFFMVTCFYGVCMRIANGMLTADLLAMLGIGLAGLLAGTAMAVRTVSKLDGEKIKRLVYCGIGVAGMITLANSR